MSESDGDACREDLHKHLDFIQSVVTRMSAASTSTKSWLLPVVTAAYGYGMTRNAWSVVALGLGAVLLFMFLDAHYLDREKAYRALYDAVARNEGVPLFSLDPGAAHRPAPREPTSSDITPEEAEERVGNDDDENTGRWVKLKEVLTGWVPDSSVWKSWAITPFYGSLVLVGVVILFRVVVY